MNQCLIPTKKIMKRRYKIETVDKALRRMHPIMKRDAKKWNEEHADVKYAPLVMGTPETIINGSMMIHNSSLKMPASCKKATVKVNIHKDERHTDNT